MLDMKVQTTTLTFLPRGERRLLDDAWFSPNLLAAFSGSSTLWEPGWSTHALLTLTFQFGDTAVEGNVIPPPPSFRELEQALDQVDDAVWDGERPDVLEADALYRDWLARLQRWLPRLSRPLGEMITRRKLDALDARAPLRPRHFWRANIACKLHHKLTELSTLHARLWPEGPLPFRVCQLYKYVQKAPWDAWQALPPLIPLGHLPDYGDVALLLDWMAVEWQAIYSLVTEDIGPQSTTMAGLIAGLHSHRQG